MRVLGIDIGGSGIKAAPVDLGTGRLTEDRLRLPTPDPATPAAVGDAVRELVQQLRWRGAIGCTFPAVIRNGVACTAANIDRSWIGTHVDKLISRKAGRPVRVLNDADAAGLAEVHFGAARGKRGTVLLLTIGTGIGSALIVDGKLVPNTELGHLELHGDIAERRASDRARKRKDLSWKRWAGRLGEYLQHLELLFSPDLFILGGGVSRKHERFLHRLETRARVVPARLRNDAGIIGAALGTRHVRTS